MHSFGSPREATSSAAATKYLSCCNSIGVSYWGNKHKLFPYINHSLERRLGANSIQPENLTGLAGRRSQPSKERNLMFLRIDKLPVELPASPEWTRLPVRMSRN